MTLARRSVQLLLAAAGILAAVFLLGIVARLVPDDTVHRVAFMALPLLIPVAAAVAIGAAVVAIVALARGARVPGRARRDALAGLIGGAVLVLVLPALVIAGSFVIAGVGSGTG